MGYAFTVNNYLPGTWDELVRALEGCATYIVVGYEVGESGTPHLQGYIHLRQQMRWAAINKKCPRETPWHLEPARCPIAAEKYCRKPNPDGSDKRIEQWGVMPCQGARSDLRAFTDRIEAGDDMKIIAADHPETFVRFGQGLMRYQLLQQPKYSGNRLCVWVTGPPGSGKSVRGLQQALYYAGGDLSRIYQRKGNDNWFGGYHGQRIAFFDEFRITNDGGPTSINFQQTLNLTGPGALTVPIKGGEVAWNAEIIIFTSVQDPTVNADGTIKDISVYPPKESDKALQLARRLHLKFMAFAEGERCEVPATEVWVRQPLCEQLSSYLSAPKADEPLGY